MISEKAVKALSTPEKGSVFHRFSGAKLHGHAAPVGFGVVVTSTGHKSFALNYRIKGFEKRMVIGASPTWTVLKAIKQAQALRRQVDMGTDPKGVRDDERDAATVKQLCWEFIEEHVPTLKPSTRHDYTTHAELTARELGRLRVEDVTRAHISRLHQAGKDTPYGANRLLAVRSKMFDEAVRKGYRADNPCKGIKRFVEDSRETYLTPEEIARLTEVLNSYRRVEFASFIKLLMFTGARRGEAMSAQWDHFDLDRGTWTKPGTSTKQKRKHATPLHDGAVLLLREIYARALKDSSGAPVSPYVFPGKGRAEHMRNTHDCWAEIRNEAGLPNLRVHDLRHTFASVLASGGASLQMIGKLLGHAQIMTTARYAHLFDDPLREALQIVGDVMAGTPSAEVLPIKKDQSA
jgi:integrase